MDNIKIAEEIVKSGNIIGRRRIAKEYGVSKYRSELIARIVREKSELTKLPENEIIPKNMGINEEQLRMKHDNKFIVSKKVKELPRDLYYTTLEFISMCKLRTSSGYRYILEDSEFEEYHGKAQGGNIYWGHPDCIKKLKSEGILT